MKRKVLVAALLALSVFAFGASTWEGSAIISDGVTFPTDGLFGACNSFPVNSSVEVQNLENGRKVTVVITATVDNPAVFMALSPMAASALGMKAGASARVRVLAPSAASATPAPAAPSAASPAKAGETNDPDYNPRALAAVAANPYDASVLSKGQDFMSVLGAGYASQPASPTDASAQAGSAPTVAAEAPATTASATAAATAPSAATEPARLLESAGTESPAPAGRAVSSAVPAPGNPPVPETSASAVQAPTADSPAAELATPAAAAKTEVVAAPVETGTPEASAASLAPPAARGGASLASPQPLEPESLSDNARLAATSPAPELGLAAPEAATQASAQAATLEASPEPETGPEPYALETPRMIPAEAPALTLADPSTETGRSMAAAESAASETGPSLSDVTSSSPVRIASAAGLPDPDLGPDILPEALLDRLANPGSVAPSIALADCDVELAGYETPEALAAGAPKPAMGGTGSMELAEAAAPAAPEKGQALTVPPLQPAAGKPAASATTALASPAAPAPAAAKAAEVPAAGTTTTTLTPTSPQPPKAPVAPAPATATTVQPAPAAAAAAKVAPAAPAPVATAPASVAAIPKGSPAREPTDVRMLEGMVKGSYYVQIGLFGSEEALRQAIGAVGKQFPILYERVDAGKGKILYRLYVGPIKRDESGIVLTKVKALGYRDAVLKQG